MKNIISKLKSLVLQRQNSHPFFYHTEEIEYGRKVEHEKLCYQQPHYGRLVS